MSPVWVFHKSLLCCLHCNQASGEFVGGTAPEVCRDTPAVGAPPGGEGGEGSSSASKQEPSGVGQSTADDTLSTPPPVDKDASLPIGAAQSGRVTSPHVPTTPTSDHQPTPSESLSAEKERSECALPPTAALGVLSLGSAVGQTCVCVRAFMRACVFEYLFQIIFK